PDPATILNHPFFWSANDRLNFLCDVSDHFEFEPRDPPSPSLQALQAIADTVMPGHDFLKLLPALFKESLGKQRKYQGHQMLDLLRALRNKRNHYNDMPEPLKESIGGLPDGYLFFWTSRFPPLLMECHKLIRQIGVMENDRFKGYFVRPE
ncbi:bifunctional endoribonuclease/protein kinase ire1, partial [Ascosphaera atra]